VLIVVGEDDGERARLRRWRRDWLALMLSITFAGGMLAGMLVLSLGIPAAYLAPLVFAINVGFFVSVRWPWH
jgi:hypothetical protein